MFEPITKGKTIMGWATWSFLPIPCYIIAFYSFRKLLNPPIIKFQWVYSYIHDALFWTFEIYDLYDIET
jgi:hypothetical protein